MKFLPQNIQQVRTDRKSLSPKRKNESESEVPIHVFDEKSIRAVNGALAAGRPLLIRGEPGVGKTQLAIAVAAALKRPLVSHTVNSRTESTDLLWRMDAVRRLAEAQLCAAMGQTELPEVTRARMEERRFVDPGPLWWGFNWGSARDQVRYCRAAQGMSCEDADIPTPDRGGDPQNGVVVLIDEIDKAESDVPNGLLEAFGNREFTPLACTSVVADNTMPLVIITTNQERVLPDAFIRRCLVLYLPPQGEDDLIARGKARFGAKHLDLLKDAARQLMIERDRVTLPKPGLAEYLDLVRAVLQLAESQNRKPKDIMAELSEFTLRKQSGGRK